MAVIVAPMCSTPTSAAVSVNAAVPSAPLPDKVNAADVGEMDEPTLVPDSDGVTAPGGEPARRARTVTVTTTVWNAVTDGPPLRAIVAWGTSTTGSVTVTMPVVDAAAA